MSWLAIFMFFIIVLGLVTNLVVLVWFDETPMWIIYAAFPMTALAGGAAINMILHGIPT